MEDPVEEPVEEPVRSPRSQQRKTDLVRQAKALSVAHQPGASGAGGACRERVEPLRQSPVSRNAREEQWCARRAQAGARGVQPIRRTSLSVRRDVGAIGEGVCGRVAGRVACRPQHERILVRIERAEPAESLPEERLLARGTHDVPHWVRMLVEAREAARGAR
jgi:hypothetical protein